MLTLIQRLARRPFSMRAALVFVVANSLQVRAQVVQTPALADVRSVIVSVDISPHCQMAYVDSVRIRTETELRLRRMGIVVTKDAPVTFSLVADCKTTATSSQPGADIVVTNVFARVSEWATLKRLRRLGEYLVTTWEFGWWNSADASATTSSIVKGIDAISASFENEWLQANPKRP